MSETVVRIFEQPAVSEKSMSGAYALKGLDKLQLGHIRHFNNLSRQLPNQWELMKGKGYGQEDFGGFRFQLAYMAYALALTHKHRLPAAPGLFKPIFERLIEKISSSRRPGGCSAPGPLLFRFPPIRPPTFLSDTDRRRFSRCHMEAS